MEIKEERTTNKIYRILAIALVFFAAGAFFFYKDKRNGVNDVPEATNYQNIQIANNTPFQDPIFSKFPSPDKFQKFIYDKTGINGGDSFPISVQCGDAFLTVLIFPSAVDYRQDVAKAIFNRAFGCATGEKFSHEIIKNDLVNYGFGSYYLIIADQGLQGMWYNPR